MADARLHRGDALRGRGDAPRGRGEALFMRGETLLMRGEALFMRGEALLAGCVFRAAAGAALLAWQRVPRWSWLRRALM